MRGLSSNGAPRRSRTRSNTLPRKSPRRKATAFQSAMSMLTFYINRAGKQLSKSRLSRLERAKDELRHDFGKAAKALTSAMQ